MVKTKVGFDFHGVIDQEPNFFAFLSYTLRTEGHEVHIITGQELCDELFTKLNKHNIEYTRIFSITSYHKKIGTYITYKDGDKTQPLIAPPIWDKTKANYAAEQGLHFHIDNSKNYEEYFKDITTQYLLYTPELRALLFQLMGWSDRFSSKLLSILRPIYK